jgi:hypothetical protein
LLFAHLTEKTTNGIYGEEKRQTKQNKLFFAALVCTMALPVGLRRIYNDTGAYIDNFNKSMTLLELFASGKLHLLANPAFHIYESLIHDLTDNYHIFFLIHAFFVQYSFIHTIRRYADSFTLSIGLYICIGTYVISMAAMKQTLAMAFLMLALPKILKKKYLSYYFLVFIAFLFHTYAIVFAFLPLFTVRPWKMRTFILLAVVFVVIQNFEAVIGSFLDYANEQGKTVAEYEVFNDAQINIFRVAVYGVVPLMSLLLRPYLLCTNRDSHYYLLIHMSIISFMFMLMGTINGANMFGRMANYFELGTICSMMWILNKAYNKASVRFLTFVASGCFLFYFYYAYRIALDFDQHYRAISILEFFQSF